MKKTRDDGTDYDVALYARAADGRAVRGMTYQEELISTDDYDVDEPSDAEIEYAHELFGSDAEIIFFESEV